jgi:cyclopropane fatty-acyl-phospholipid synthase-like methyltransferase
MALTDAHAAIEREAIGGVFGANGYTTVTQADALGERLRLAPGKRLLDLGCGRGWPGLYLARKSGCNVVLSDLPEPALRFAQARSEKDGLAQQVEIVRGSAVQPPFRARSFDAVSHTDTL